jgi:hypothetical protein
MKTDSFESSLKNKGKSLLTLGDLAALAACGRAVLVTNRELKGNGRRALRLAVNRALCTLRNA